MKGRRCRKIIWLAAAALAFGAAAVFISILWEHEAEKLKAEKQYEEMRQEKEPIGEREIPESEEVKDIKNDAEGAEKKPKPEIPVNFEQLTAINSDIYAWITIPGTDIDYPAVQCMTDDSYYITHGIDREENVAGAIFSEHYNKMDFSDPHTVLYGHNMRDGSMFAGLHAFEDNTFFEEHREIKIYTPDAVRTYRIFAAYRDDNHHLLKIYDCSDKNVFAEYLREIDNQREMESNVDRDMEITTDDRILTLSTCDRTGTVSRYVVQAVLVEELME